VRGSRAGKLCICRLVVEVRVILFSLLFTGRIERGFFSVLIWCMRVSNPNPSRGSPSDSKSRIADWRLLTLARTSSLKVHHLNNHHKKLQISFSPPSFYIFNISWWQLTNYTHYHTALKTVTTTNRRQGYVLVALP